MRCQLKQPISMSKFLLAVDRCEGEVTFESTEGDILNLKSQLSKYLFLAAAPDTKYLMSGKISCKSEDASVLTEYICTP